MRREKKKNLGEISCQTRRTRSRYNLHREYLQKIQRFSNETWNSSSIMSGVLRVMKRTSGSINLTRDEARATTLFSVSLPCQELLTLVDPKMGKDPPGLLLVPAPSPDSRLRSKGNPTLPGQTCTRIIHTRRHKSDHH